MKQWPRAKSCSSFAMIVCGCAAACSVEAALAQTIAVKAARVYTGAGESYEPGVVILRDGDVVSVGTDTAIPDDVEVIEIAGSVVTPGLIDAMCTLANEVPEGSRRRVLMPESDASLTQAPYTTGPEASSRGVIVPEAAVSPHRHVHDSVWSKFAHDARPGSDPNDLVCCVLAPAADSTPLASAISARETWAEHASEVVPHYDVIDSVNLLSHDFDRLARSGVTTVFVSPDSASVIGSRGAVVKTAGQLDRRVVERRSAVKATLGGDPSRRGRGNIMPFGTPDLHTRRPTTRMGVEWVFRKAFYDAIRDGAGMPVGGADTPPAGALPILRDVLAGKIPLRIQARMQHDIFSALRLCAEFDLHFLLEEPVEIYQCLDAVVRSGAPVVYGPIFMVPQGIAAVNGEADDARLTTPRRLHESGVTFAITAQSLRDEEGLARQAMYAMRYGLSKEAALDAVTSTPATLLGLADRIGTLAAGRDGDLVIWSAEPFGAESKPLVVIVDGQVVYRDK
jgi:imidazolonepropionase-like amidohydrolase